jgi:hypothetical protein
MLAGEMTYVELIEDQWDTGGFVLPPSLFGLDLENAAFAGFICGNEIGGAVFAPSDLPDPNPLTDFH